MKKLFIISLLCFLTALGLAPGAHAQGSCTIVSLPFTEGFENTGAGVPTCFTRNPLGIYQVNNILYPEVNGSTPHTGSKALWAFNNAYSDTAAQVPTLIFPELGEQFDMSSMVLEFWARVAWNTHPYLVVGVMTDPDDLSTFTSVGTVHFPSTETYAKYTIYFSDYVGTGRYIAIKMANDPGNAGKVFIDDIILNQMALCSTVRNLELQNLYGTDVTLNWSPNDLGTANYYDLMLVNNNTELVTSFTTTDTFYTFTDLDYGTQYTAYVSVVCTNGMQGEPDSVFFRTLPEPVVYPYSENFEGDPDSVLARYNLYGVGQNQWTLGTAVGLPDPYGPEGAPVHSLYISNNGSSFAYYGDSASRSYATFNILFPEQDWEYHFAFDYRVQGEILGAMPLDYLSVYMVDADVDIPDNAVPSGAALIYQAHGVMDWTHVDVILPNVNGTAKQFLFFWNNNVYNEPPSAVFSPAAVDNIAIYGNVCPQPVNLTASNITDGSATVSWTETGSATEWTFYYKPYLDAGSYQQIVVENDPTVDLSSLTPNTEYLFYVVANCVGESSMPTAISHFRTTCGVIAQLPYIEDFEMGVYTQAGEYDYVSCWGRSSSDSVSVPYVNDEADLAYSGDNYLDFNYTPEISNIAVLPELDATIEVSNLMMAFQTCHTWYGSFGTLGTLEVGVMTDPADTNTFVTVYDVDLAGVAQYSYQEQQVSFVNYTGTGKYIAFRSSNSQYCTYLVDDITLDIRPACMYPTQFGVMASYNDSVTLTWHESGEATSWNIAYGTPGFTPEAGTMVTVDSTTATITGLANVTDYEAYVRADCDDSQSPWVGPVAFTTGVVRMQQLGDDTLTTCEAIICDDGGENGNHSEFCTSTMVVYPGNGNGGLQITGTCDIDAANWIPSVLKFYDGVGTDGTLLASYTGSVTDIMVASAGPITIRFTSGYSSAPGYKLYVSCISCTPPSDVHVSAIQTNSAVVSWSGSADSYTVILSGDANASYTVTGNTLTLSNLTSASSYQVAVRAYCGTDSSLLSPATAFQTACEPLTVTADIPWTEDFEGYTGSGNQPFVCWDRPMVAAEYNAPFVYCGWSASCHSGANSAEFKGSNAMLALPAFTNDIHTLQLSFWATATAVMSGTLDIGVVTDITDPNSFEYVATCGQPGPRGPEGSTENGVLMGPFNFSNVVASTGRIALRYSNSESSESWNLDDFVVAIFEEDTTIVVDPCNVPAGLHTTSVENHAISIAWDAADNVSSWDVQYRVADGSWTIISSTVNSCTLSGLEGLTSYQIRVRAQCGDINYSDWTAVITAQTTNVGLQDYLTSRITLYPNPANEVVNVQCTEDNVQVEAVEVIDVYGKAVRTVVGANDYSPLQTRINVSGLADGVYFVRVTTDAGVVTKPFVKR